jgi:hypothetical protein
LKTCEMPSNLRIEIKAVFLSLAGGRARTWRIGRSGAYTLGLGVHTECLQAGTPRLTPATSG